MTRSENDPNNFDILVVCYNDEEWDHLISFTLGIECFLQRRRTGIGKSLEDVEFNAVA